MIRIVVDDLAFLPVDAVVRPATADLAPASPAAEGLDRIGAEALAEGRRLHAGLEAGAAVVTPGGELAAPFVLHVVVRDEERGPAAHLLRRALTGAWQRAADWGLPRIACPVPGPAEGATGAADGLALLEETWAAGPMAGIPGTELLVVVDGEEERLALESARTARGAA